MGLFRVRARTVGLLLIGVHLSGAAAAAERVAMPFDCRATGGGVELVPSQERSYSIVGTHESEIFSACSPADPNRCRSWFVHRFDLDCNGARVAWMDVAEAAMRHYGRRAWVENGRFHLRMGRMWTFDGGRAFRAGERQWMRDEGYEPRRGLAGHDETGRPYRRDSRVVTLPPGYAPSRGIPVTFSRAPAPSPDTTAEARQTPDRARAQAPVATAAPLVPEPVPELPQRAPRSEIAAAMAKSGPEAAPKKLAMAEAAKPAIAATKATETDDAGTESSSKGPGLTIINAPGAAEKEAETAATEPPKEEPVEPEVQAKPDQASTSEINTGSTNTMDEEVVAAAEPVSNPPPVSSVSPEPSKPGSTMLTPTTVAAALALALAALAATMGFRKRGPELVRVTPAEGRDYGSISLDRAYESNPAAGASLTLRTEEAPSAESSPGSNSLGMAPDFPIPATYEQALDVLGASPDASLAAIKKIVDGLRQNWHPDYARTEADRLYRESRSRQINVAWDLVAQRSSAA